MLGFFKKKPENYFSVVEKQQITDAIQKAEHRTSGEIRVFIEGICPDEDPVGRAKTIFNQLQMANTAARNGVLVYVAMKNRKLAVFGDQGIHEKVGDQFWTSQVALILQHFNQNNYAEGIAGIVHEIGEVLFTHFPFDKIGDKNELPDDIVFGS